MRHAGSLPPELVEAHKKLRSIVHQMENAIANHEFEKARLYSTEERKQRDTIQLLQTKWGEKIGGAATVTVEDVEEALSRWTGMPVTLIRHEVADTGEPGSKLSKTTRKRKKKSS
jgi:ATP-dependent Clp protease ATP-binding subunit ClpC